MNRTERRSQVTSGSNLVTSFTHMICRWQRQGEPDSISRYSEDGFNVTFRHLKHQVCGRGDINTFHTKLVRCRTKFYSGCRLSQHHSSFVVRSTPFRIHLAINREPISSMSSPIMSFVNVSVIHLFSAFLVSHFSPRIRIQYAFKKYSLHSHECGYVPL